MSRNSSKPPGRLAAADALLAFEGNNEPNNWGVTYQGEPAAAALRHGWQSRSCNAILYNTVKNDPVLKKYPVWSISEAGAEADNVGLQFLTDPRRRWDFAAGGNTIRRLRQCS